MKVNLNVNLWTVIAIVVAVLWMFNRSNLKNDGQTWEDNYNAVVKGVRRYASSVDSVMISVGHMLQSQDKKLRDVMKSDSIQRELVGHYKRLSAVVKIETKFVHDTIEKRVPIYIDKDTTLDVWSDCFEMDISLESGLLSINNIFIENRQDIVLGARKSTLWRTEQAIDVRNTNPCITTTGMTTYKVVVDKKWHQKWWITAPISFGTGYVLGKARGN
jgi:hypothetical protein